MNQRMISTRHVYTRASRHANRPGRRPPARALWLALALATLPARALAEEHVRVLVRASPERVEELRLEDYVAGVVAGEMPASFPPEALKAQAVAARSFALTRRLEAVAAGRRWDVTADVVSQVFRRGPAPAAARAAAEGTAGEVLALGMEPVEAYFHASCGARTEAGLAALGRDLPYLRPVACGRCDGAPGVRWTVRVPAAELGRAAGLGAKVTAVRVAARTATGRAERVELAAGPRKVTLGGADLRQRLGWSRLPSLAFDVSPDGAAFAFAGAGRGHGAGLCQWGAAGLAREGKGYREILAHYYPDTEVVRMY
jgi:stage II sporulation protein D